MSIVGQNNWEGLFNWVVESLREIPSGKKILDAGAGELKYKQYCSHLEYTAQDFGGYEGLGDGKGIQEGKWDQTRIDLVSDIVSIPVESSYFDAILCSEVIEHVSEPVIAIRELYRILKPDGILLITAPCFSFLHFAPFHYYTGFTLYFFERILGEIGFDIETVYTNGDFFEQIAQNLWYLSGYYQKYSAAALNKNDTQTIEEMIAIVSRLRQEAFPSSSELSCYGYCVKAIKRS